MQDPEHEREVSVRSVRAIRVKRPLSGLRGPSTTAEERRVIEMLRQARGSVAGAESSLAALRRRVRQLEDENQRLRHGPQGGAA
jgi:hypothetical protein